MYVLKTTLRSKSHKNQYTKDPHSLFLVLILKVEKWGTPETMHSTTKTRNIPMSSKKHFSCAKT